MPGPVWGPKSRFLGQKINVFSRVQLTSNRVWEVLIRSQTHFRTPESLPDTPFAAECTLKATIWPLKSL